MPATKVQGTPSESPLDRQAANADVAKQVSIPASFASSAPDQKFKKQKARLREAMAGDAAATGIELLLKAVLVQCFSDTSGFDYYWDIKAKAPWGYNPSKKLFATFDDKHSIREKTKFIRRKKLGGIMFWELSQELTLGGLVEEIIDRLDKNYLKVRIH